MSKRNISKLFYRDYFQENRNPQVDYKFDFILSSNGKPSEAMIKEIARRNKAIKEVELKSIPKVPIVRKEDCFTLKILYPGLVTGIGLVHDSKKLEGGYNLGMHFDYTWGMPVVYGSSVKGVLREYFQEFYEGGMDAIDLEEEIFSGKIRNKKKDTTDKNGKLIRGYDNKSIYHRDIFFDAVITKPYKSNNKEHLLEDDSITPHGDNPLKNPLPITMLKIAPGCEIEFRFRLVDSVVDGKVFKKEDKLKLFENILKTVGVGAKTNVGYGQLE